MEKSVIAPVTLTHKVQNRFVKGFSIQFISANHVLAVRYFCFNNYRRLMTFYNRQINSTLSILAMCLAGVA